MMPQIYNDKAIIPQAYNISKDGVYVYDKKFAKPATPLPRLHAHTYPDHTYTLQEGVGIGPPVYDGAKMHVPNYGISPRRDFTGGGDLRSAYSGMHSGEETFGAGGTDLRASYDYDSAGYGDYVLPEGINLPVRQPGMAYSA